MSAEIFSLSVQKREAIGKKVKALRRSGVIPANLFGRGRKSINIQLELLRAQKVYEQAGKNHPIELTIDGGGKELVLISEIDLDPVKGSIAHLAFQVVKRGEKVSAEVPVHLVGESPAERLGNMIVMLNDAVEVEADPLQLPDHFEVDKAKLAEPDDVVTVADITVPKDVEILTEIDTPIAKVEIPRSQVEAEPETEAGEETADEAEKTSTES